MQRRKLVGKFPAATCRREAPHGGSPRLGEWPPVPPLGGQSVTDERGQVHWAHVDGLTGGRRRISIASVTTFLLAHALLLAVLAAPALLGKAHARRDRERALEARRIRCLGCGAVVGELRTCDPQEHSPDLRTIGH